MSQEIIKKTVMLKGENKTQQKRIKNLKRNDLVGDRELGEREIWGNANDRGVHTKGEQGQLCTDTKRAQNPEQRGLTSSKKT